VNRHDLMFTEHDSTVLVYLRFVYTEHDRERGLAAFAKKWSK